MVHRVYPNAITAASCRVRKIIWSHRKFSEMFAPGDIAGDIESQLNRCFATQATTSGGPSCRGGSSGGGNCSNDNLRDGACTRRADQQRKPDRSLFAGAAVVRVSFVAPLSRYLRSPETVRKWFTTILLFYFTN